jgi:hypothetical protein
MAIATKLGQIETRIRRDLVNDNEPDGYRWSPFQALSRIRKAALEIVRDINAWAGCDQATGRRIPNIESALAPVKDACDAVPTNAVTPTDPDPTVVAELREIVLPIDDRYVEAVAYLAAADLLETDNSDTVNAQTADRYRALGRELASK